MRGAMWRGIKKKEEDEEALRTEGGFDEYGLVELLDVRGDAEGGHGVEHAERVTPLEQLVRVPFVEGAGNQENDVVNHVGVGNVVEEGGEGFDCI